LRIYRQKKPPVPEVEEEEEVPEQKPAHFAEQQNYTKGTREREREKKKKLSFKLL